MESIKEDGGQICLEVRLKRIRRSVQGLWVSGRSLAEAVISAATW